MAAIQHKYSPSGAQGSRRSAHALTKTAPGKSAKTKTQTAGKYPKPQKPKKRERVPETLRFFETKRGKTTIRRFRGRTFYRIEEVKGKPVDFVQVFTSGESHSIQVRFEDKTALNFAIDPGFTLDTEYADLKTENWVPIKHWPLIRSETRRIER